MTKLFQIEKVTSLLRHSGLLMVTNGESEGKDFNSKNTHKYMISKRNGASGRNRTGTTVLTCPRILSPNRYLSQVIEIIHDTYQLFQKSYVKVTSLVATVCANSLPITTFNNTEFLPHEGARAVFQHVLGGAVSSTAALIRKYKMELQKLRAEYLRKSSDPAEQKRLETMIQNRKEVLSQLGAQREIF